MRRFNTKSIFLGLVAGVAAVVCLGAATGDARGTVGRFQGFANEGHAFVIDTTTGQVWHSNYHPNMSGRPDKAFLVPKTPAE